MDRRDAFGVGTFRAPSRVRRTRAIVANAAFGPTPAVAGAPKPEAR